MDVWIVLGEIDHEGSDVIAVFKTEAGAERFASKVRRLIEDQPKWNACVNELRTWRDKMDALGVPPIYDRVEVLQMGVRQ